MQTCYFDYNATTPLAPEVLEVMLPFLGGIYGNPSSVHHVGRRARVALDEAREKLASILGSKPSELVFTSGGTESINMAIFGAVRSRNLSGAHVITTAVEHHAVLHAVEALERHEGCRVTRLPVDTDGRVRADQVRDAMTPETVLVSVQAANNEIGTLQPVREIGELCRERGVLFHTDAVQSFGKIPFGSIADFNADLVSLCAHKFHGPKGAGVLYIRSPLKIRPLLWGGSHEDERRAGTENVAGIIGLTEASSRFLHPPVFSPPILSSLTHSVRGALEDLKSPAVQIHTPRAGALCNTVSFTVGGCDSMTLLANLDLEGICASGGSACAAGSLVPSHVILALGISPERAAGLVRISFGRETTRQEVERFTGLLPTWLERCLS